MRLHAKAQNRIPMDHTSYLSLQQQLVEIFKIKGLANAINMLFFLQLCRPSRLSSRLLPGSRPLGPLLAGKSSLKYRFDDLLAYPAVVLGSKHEDVVRDTRDSSAFCPFPVDHLYGAEVKRQNFQHFSKRGNQRRVGGI